MEIKCVLVTMKKREENAKQDGFKMLLGISVVTWLGIPAEHKRRGNQPDLGNANTTLCGIIKWAKSF